jgi:hypothetical protein
MTTLRIASTLSPEVDALVTQTIGALLAVRCSTSTQYTSLRS